MKDVAGGRRILVLLNTTNRLATKLGGCEFHHFHYNYPSAIEQANSRSKVTFDADEDVLDDNLI